MRIGTERAPGEFCSTVRRGQHPFVGEHQQVQRPRRVSVGRGPVLGRKDRVQALRELLGLDREVVGPDHRPLARRRRARHASGVNGHELGDLNGVMVLSVRIDPVSARKPFCINDLRKEPFVHKPVCANY